MNNTATVYNLNVWSKNVFEKLGWMTLAHQRRKKDELKAYVEHIDVLLEKITAKINYLRTSGNTGRLHELEILRKNVHILKRHALELWKTCREGGTSGKGASGKSGKSVKSVKNASVKNASVKGASVKGISVKNASVKNASVKNASVKGASMKEPSMKEPSMKEPSMKVESVKVSMKNGSVKVSMKNGNGNKNERTNI